MEVEEGGRIGGSVSRDGWEQGGILRDRGPMFLRKRRQGRLLRMRGQGRRGLQELQFAKEIDSDTQILRRKVVP